MSPESLVSVATRRWAFCCLLATMIGAVVLPSCGGRAPATSIAELPFELDRAVDYEIFQQEDISSRARKRTRAFIYSEAQTIDERVHTAFRAAVDLQERNGSSFLKVFHLISPDLQQVGMGTYLAVLSFAPDGLGVDGETPLRNGVWEADVTDEVIDNVTKEVERLWWANRDRFQVPDEFGGTETDEAAMKLFISGELGIDAEQVKLVSVWLQPYPEGFSSSP